MRSNGIILSELHQPKCPKAESNKKFRFPFLDFFKFLWGHKNAEKLASKY